MPTTNDAVSQIVKRLGRVVTELDDYQDDADDNHFHYLLGARAAYLVAFDIMMGRS